MEKQIYAKVFDNYTFVSQEHLELFIQTMDDQITLKILVDAIKSAYERGAYTIGEVEIISKAIRNISTPKDETK